jgi:hypothetical protein
MGVYLFGKYIETDIGIAVNSTTTVMAMRSIPISLAISTPIGLF